MILPSALFILFLALRLTNHIDWEWYVVAAPLWLPVGLGVIVVLFSFIMAALVSAVKPRRRLKVFA